MAKQKIKSEMKTKDRRGTTYRLHNEDWMTVQRAILEQRSKNTQSTSLQAILDEALDEWLRKRKLGHLKVMEDRK